MHLPLIIHYQMSKDALLAGKHVVCSLWLNRQEAEELVELADKKGLVNCSFQYSLIPLLVRRRMVKEGSRKVLAIHGSYSRIGFL